MNRFQRLAGAVVAAGLVLGSMTLVAGAAEAAPSACASQNQAVGKARVREVNHNRHAAQTAKQLTKAKKAYKKHHTAANKKKLTKAQTANRKAQASKKLAAKRHDTAVAAAHKCAATPVTAPTATSGIQSALGNVLPQALVSQLGSVLGNGQVLPAQLDGVTDQLKTLLNGGVTGDQISSAVEGVEKALPSSVPLDPATLTSLLAALGGSGLTPDALAAIVGQISTDLLNAGLTADQVSTALTGVLVKLSTGELGTDSTFVPNLLWEVNGAVGQLSLVGATALNAVNVITNSLTPSLNALVGNLNGSGNLLSGVPPVQAPAVGGLLG